MKIRDILENNQEAKDDIFIHLCKEKREPYGVTSDILWEGWLKELPTKYLESEVSKLSESLKDMQNGVNGYYIEIANNDRSRNVSETQIIDEEVSNGKAD